MTPQMVMLLLTSRCLLNSDGDSPVRIGKEYMGHKEQCFTYNAINVKGGYTSVLKYTHITRRGPHRAQGREDPPLQQASQRNELRSPVGNQLEDCSICWASMMDRRVLLATMVDRVHDDRMEH
ncbi:hypothetical protein BC827DRAFT_1154952 [Russula dissimulans]|nr:hypothetical protein BC827DRAFT_1154952 [Russula dissimulans]